MKKILLLFAMLLTLSAVGQNAVGDWFIHTSYVGKDVTAVVEGRQWVYYLAGNCLFRLDKETGENEAMSMVGDLSDMGVSSVYYNWDKDYLVVVYSNSNIDIINSDGSVTNMPEIKDAVMTSSRRINDVTFAPGLMYLATDFGYVVIDDVKRVVKESHLYRTPLTSVARLGDVLLLSTADAAYYGDANVYHEQLSSFNVGGPKTNCRFMPIDETRLFCVTNNTSLSTMTLDSDGKASFTSDRLFSGKSTSIQPTHGGGYLFNVPSQGKYYTCDAEFGNLTEVELPGEVCSSHPAGNGDIWAAGPKGLHLLNSESYYLPNALSFANPFWMTYNKSQDKLYVSTPTANAFFQTTIPTAVNTYDGVKWTDVTPEGAPVEGSYWIDFLPSAPDTYLLGTWRNGLLKVVGDEITMTYDTTNSPIAQNWSMHPITTVDRNGNVWVVQSLENPDHPVMVLPAAKVKLDNTTASDWMTPTIDGIHTGHTQFASFISTKMGSNDIKIFSDGDFQTPIFFWNSGGEISSRPQQANFDRFYDQDGETVSWTYIMSFAEDLNGYVWVGSTEGIFMLNPAAVFNSSNFTVTRPKVPRTDGTGMADRLLDGIQVNDIAVDGANRKWIATQSGLFLVSANGDQVIQKFNTTNSPLASNTIYRVCCNPNSNSVYLATPAGLYEYFSDSSPAEPTYDDIYAYPNPVRPDYGNNVTIMGLMDNTLVKIADASGNVIRQLKSTGGMTTWDCCDQNGNQVKSGVYFVICSRSTGSESVVTKIAVIR